MVFLHKKKKKSKDPLSIPRFGWRLEKIRIFKSHGFLFINFEPQLSRSSQFEPSSAELNIRYLLSDVDTTNYDLPRLSTLVEFFVSEKKTLQL